VNERRNRPNNALGLVLLLLLGALAAVGQPATTTVADQFFTAVGPTYCSGSFTLSWVDFYSLDGFLIKGGTSAPIPVNSTGHFSVNVVPTNINTHPASGIYTVKYSLQPTNCAPGSEFWNVPQSGPVNLLGVRTLPTPPPSLIPITSLQPPITSGTVGLCAINFLVQWSSACGGGSGGGVTSVSAGNLSPLFTTSVSNPTTIPAITFALSTHSANTVFAGPTTGSAAAPTFRALVGADLPNPSATTLGGIESYAAVTHQFINQISTLGVPSSVQPDFSDLSGSVSCGQLPALTGDTTSSGCATVTSGINGLAVPASTAVLATNSSRQIVVATAAGVVSLFSTCSGVQYLGADGACHNAGTGTVTSIATTSPISGGTITGTGTISCPTCATAAGSLDVGRLLVGGGSKALAVGDLSGDASTSGSTLTTVTGINGGSVPASAKVLGTNASSQPVPAIAADVVSLFSTCSGVEYLGADGACHSAGSGSVTSIATSSPITGGTITTSGTIACATCVTSAASLTNNAFLMGAGSQGAQSVTALVATAALNLFTTTLQGLTPASGGGTVNFLRADGTWQAPAGTGTVTSIATTSPISGGTITSTGTISCSTCVTSASATLNHLQVGAGGQAISDGDLSGDVTTGGSEVTTVVKVHGVTYPSGPSANTVPVVTSATSGGTVTYEAVPNAALANSSLTVAAGSGISVSGCGPVSLGGTCTVSETANVRTRAFGGSFDGAGSALTTTNATTYFTIPYACTISAYNIVVDAGTITFDVWKIATGTAHPTIANTITASALPALSTGTAIHSTTLTGWTTSVSANDIFAVVINTVATAKTASLVLQCDE